MSSYQVYACHVCLQIKYTTVTCVFISSTRLSRMSSYHVRESRVSSYQVHDCHVCLHSKYASHVCLHIKYTIVTCVFIASTRLSRVSSYHVFNTLLSLRVTAFPHKIAQRYSECTTLHETQEETVRQHKTLITFYIKTPKETGGAIHHLSAASGILLGPVK